MEIRRYWFIVTHRFWLILVAAILGGAISFVNAITTTPLYLASVTLVVTPATTSAGTTADQALAGIDWSPTYSALITTRPVLEQTIRDLHLSLSPEALNLLVTVRVVRNTHLLQILVTNSNPTLARDIANTLAADFIQDNQAQQLGSITTSQNALKQQVADVNAQMRTTASRLNEIAGSQSVESAQLQSNLNQEQATYWELQRSLTDLQLNQARIEDLARIVEPAITPPRPFAPIIRQQTLTGVGLGVLVGIGLAFLLEYLDDTVKNQDDVREASGLIPLGSVMRLRRDAGLVLMVQGFQTNSQFAEAYRMLRANVDFARVDVPGNAFLVTSSGQGEGKSTTLVNLAVALAESGRSVLAIDADLRRPTLHKAFGLVNDVGLTSLLVSEVAGLDVAIQSTHLANIRVIPSGPQPPNPAELLGSGRMRRLLERARQEADVVLVDSPPVLAVADPTVLAAVVDGVILVVAAGQTRMGELTRARQVLSQGPVHLLGVILNKVGNRQGGYYYYYSYKTYRSTDDAGAHGPANGKANGAVHHRRGLGRLVSSASRQLSKVLRAD